MAREKTGNLEILPTQREFGVLNSKFLDPKDTVHCDICREVFEYS